jgi:hypothetical protein
MTKGGHGTKDGRGNLSNFSRMTMIEFQKELCKAANGPDSYLSLMDRCCAGKIAFNMT